MILTLDTPIVSNGTFTVSQVVAAIVAQSNRTRYSDAEVRELVDRTIHWCQVFGFNHDLVLSQMVHETDWFRFTGDVPFGAHNFAGLGATGGVPGHRFLTIDAGVLAVVAHHAVYRYGAKPNWPQQLQQYAGNHIDPRYSAVLSTGNAGKMIVLGDYRGTWAVPGRTYPESLITRSRQIEAFPRGEESPMPVGIPGVPWFPADRRHYTPGRSVDWPDLLIQHHTDGYDSLGWLTTSPNSNVSASYLLNHDGTIRGQLVDHRDTPHTTAAYNDRSISCEWERKWPEQSDIPDATYQNIGEFWAGVVRVEQQRGNPNFQGVPRRNQLRDHNDFYNTTCPGNLDMDRVYPIMVAALAQQPSPPAVDNPDCLSFHTGFEVCHAQGGFLGHYQEFDGIVTLGYPRSPDFGIEDPTSPTGHRNVQVFDKGILIFLIENPDGQRVQRLHFKSPLWQRVVDRAVATYGDWQAA